MIVFVLTGPQRGTHAILRRSRRFDFRIASYDQVLRATRLQRATYIFSDFDRLNFWELELSGRIYRRLESAGMRVWNNPARVLQRCALLRRLYDNGFNRFDVWRVEDGEQPVRFPVFLRTQSAHRGALTELLHDTGEVQRAVREAVDAGIPLRELILVEYCAEPVKPDLFRKLSVFRVGPAMVPWLSVHESRWSAKHGQEGAAGQDLYDEELALVTENRFGEALRPAFEAAAIDYGRTDFGLVSGRPQVYEINTNPSVQVATSHPFPVRLESARIAFSRLEEAFQAADTITGGPPVILNEPEFATQRYHDRWITRTRWTP